MNRILYKIKMEKPRVNIKRIFLILAVAIILMGYISSLEENPACGDSEMGGEEQCDDGNTRNGDGCSSVCNVEGQISCEARQKIGDINGDGSIDKLDGQIATSIIFGRVNFPQDTCCIDVDENGQFDISDAVKIVNIYSNEAESPGRCSYTVSCGDGIVDSGEQCDDGKDNGDRCDNDNHDCEYCSASCKIIELEEKDDDNNYREKRSIFLYNNVGDFCSSNWRCTGWTDCDGGVITRKCRDANNCVYPLNKPSEIMGCDSTNENYISGNEESVKEIYYSIPFGLLILIAVLLLFILVFAVNWRHIGGR